MTHYHPNHPENHNLLMTMTNKRLNLANAWNGKEWFFKNKNDVIYDLMHSSYDKIDESYDKYRTELNRFKRINYSKFRKEFANPSKKFLKNMKNDI